MGIKEQNTNGVTVIKLKCANTLSISASRFKNYIMNFVHEGKKKLIVDFSATNHVDSAFLGAIIYLSKEFKLNGGEVRIVKSRYHGHIWSLLELTKTHQELKNFDNLEEAIQSYSLN